MKNLQEDIKKVSRVAFFYFNLGLSAIQMLFFIFLHLIFLYMVCVAVRLNEIKSGQAGAEVTYPIYNNMVLDIPGLADPEKLRVLAGREYSRDIFLVRLDKLGFSSEEKDQILSWLDNYARRRNIITAKMLYLIPLVECFISAAIHLSVACRYDLMRSLPPVFLFYLAGGVVTFLSLCALWNSVSKGASGSSPWYLGLEVKNAPQWMQSGCLVLLLYVVFLLVSSFLWPSKWFSPLLLISGITAYFSFTAFCAWHSRFKEAQQVPESGRQG